LTSQIVLYGQCFLRRFRLYFLLLTCGFLLSVVACSKSPAHAPQLTYKLTQHAYQSELISPLTLQVEDRSVQLMISFKGGGGSYDAARLERSGDGIRIILFDTDGKLQNMWVIYQLSGMISDLEPGGYKLQINDSNRTVIAEDVFTIR
jgi:hypothetical protein